jgi:hypothetical protein
MTKLGWIFLFLLCLAVRENVFAQDLRAPYNEAILDIIKTMPVGGGYDTSNNTFKRLKAAVEIQERKFVFNMENTTPSFCSSATFLVFLKLVSQMQSEHKLSLASESLSNLLIKAEPDGSGVWGRWNANGPGTAKLFYELDLGINFTEIAKALPGDFMKAFWSDEIGARERGHSVVFTGTREGGAKICFWSSNSASATQPAGMGEKCLIREKFRHVVFSRLQSLENLNQVSKKIVACNYSDKYLAAMLKRDSSPEEMCAQIGCREF